MSDLTMRITCALVCLALMLMLWFYFGSNGAIPYPKPYPNSVAIEFLPGTVSDDGLDFNSTFSPDGHSFYFSRSYKEQWDIFESHYQEGAWSTPIRVSFSDEHYSEADPMFSPEGKLFFISNKPLEGHCARKDFDIWYVERTDAGRWSAPQNLSEVNSDSAEYYVSFSKNGNLYFGSARPGGYGREDIYVSNLVNGVYMLPKNLGRNVNSTESEHDPCVTSDEALLVFKSENRTDGLGQADLYFSTLGRNMIWAPAKNLGSSINTTGYDYCPYFSPDGRFFFFSSQSNIMWINMEEVQRITSN